MARCLKGECSLEEHEVLADLLSANPDLKQEYEILQDYFNGNADDKRHTPCIESSLQKKFERITRKLVEEGIL
jgi:hypothetical protein